MKMCRAFIVLAVFLGFSHVAQARKPAVEDFVGVEHEEFAQSVQGAETLFEFGNTVKAAKSQKTSQLKDWVPEMVLTAFLLLPFGMWAAITRSTKRLGQLEQEAPGAQVAHLADYSKRKEEDQEEDFKQAS